jgi:thiaminase/transcriptional activator TenA
MKFTDNLWQNALPVYKAILRHPFNRELMDGSLSTERFLFYIQQDFLFLVDYGRALSLLAGRSPDPATMTDFLRLAESVIAGERGMQDEFFKIFGITQPSHEKCPACFTYTNFLIATVLNKTYGEAVTAVLPCFWIYREIGGYIFRNARKGNPYRKWIDTYASTEFSVSVDKAIEITNTAAQTHPELRPRMEEVFQKACRLEWMFWEAAYRREAWPPLFLERASDPQGC